MTYEGPKPDPTLNAENVKSAPSKATIGYPTLSTFNNSKTELSLSPMASEYKRNKEKTDALKYAKYLYSQNEYLADYELNIKPKPTNSTEAYKEKVATFSKRITNAYSKDLTKYTGILCDMLINFRKKDALFEP